MKLYFIVLIIAVSVISCNKDKDKNITGAVKEVNHPPCLSLSTGGTSDWLYIKNYPESGDNFSLMVQRGVSGFSSYVSNGSKSITAEVTITRDAFGRTSSCTVKLGSKTLRYPADACD